MQAGVELGVYPTAGMRMIAQSVKGAAELILNNDTHPAIAVSYTHLYGSQEQTARRHLALTPH